MQSKFYHTYIAQKLLVLLYCLTQVVTAHAQDDVYPAPAQQQTIIIKNGDIYTANGAIIKQGSIVIKAGKIAAVGNNIADETGAVIIDATGKNIYPGLILANSDLGLKEIESGVRGSNDYFEIGNYNPSVKASYAYNADSKIINTLRSSGILLAGVAPGGNLITGTSSVMQLDGWNWQDALYKANNGLHLNMPALMQSPRRSSRMQSPSDPVKQGINTIEDVQHFFQEAQAYYKQPDKKNTNLKFEALRPLFDRKQKLFIHADIVRQILVGIDFAKRFDIPVVIVGGSESYHVANLLKQNNIPVILNALHALPTMEDDDIDQPFKNPSILQKAGVLFAINDNDGSARYRNLAYNAGTAVAYGLSADDALKAITINAAKILGIDDKTGSIEAGKDANIIICEGDIMDMQHSNVTDAFIQGRKINLMDKHKQLYQKYKQRYNIQ